MYVDRVPNRNSPPAILLRESYRVDGRVKKRTLANLSHRHLRGGTLVLYDVSSTYFGGRSCPLARLGHSRDGKPNKLQIVFGLLCAVDGWPIAVEVFEGNVGDPAAPASQIAKLKRRLRLERVVLVGDRGMITTARLEAALDGLYVLRTSVAADALDTTGIVAGYKRLATVERAFRSHKTVDLEVRSIHHRRSDRVRAHVFHERVIVS